MASRGSVIPLFINQIKTGKPTYHYRPRNDSFYDDTWIDAVELVALCI